MHYYKHHIGDYRRCTAHLSLLEHGVYRQLLDWYYLDESPIPNETQSVYRRLAARTEAEQCAVDAVLADFFTQTPDGWINNRCSKQIGKYQDNAEKNRESGKLGGRPKKTESVIDGFNSETESKPNDNTDITLTTNHKPPTTNQQPLQEQKHTPPANAADPCPHAEIISAYHELLPTMPAVREWTDTRKSLLRSRWREKAERQSVDWWRGFFADVSKSDFLCGRTDKPFTCSLEWMLKPTNFTKIIEGFYIGRQGQAQAKPVDSWAGRDI